MPRKRTNKVPVYSLPLADGRSEVRPINAPPMIPFPHTSKWTASTAARMTETYSRFLGSVFGTFVADQICDRMEQTASENPWLDDDRDPARSLQMSMAQSWSGTDFAVVLAEDSFVEMLTAAALSAPQELLKREELISPEGVIYFEHEQEFPEEFRLSLPLRAMSWHRLQVEGVSMLHVMAYCEAPHVAQAWADYSPSYAAPRELGYYLHTIGWCITPIDDGQHQHADEKDRITPLIRAVNGFIRSISAIAESSHTRDEMVSTESKKAKKYRERKGTAAPRDVRVLSLRNPEYGRYELDAATGRKLRQHWVRGHWRNQWYAGEQINKTIWIDGFVRGDAALGTVTGQKVYVARAPKDEETLV